MTQRRFGTGMLAAVLMAIVLNLATPRPAHAFIHEIIAAMCRFGGEEVIPPGQIREGQSFIRALQASGFISSIVATPTLVTVNFDPTVPNSKFMSSGSNLLIEDGFGPGVDLLLSPLVIPDPAFPAHAVCKNLR